MARNTPSLIITEFWEKLLFQKTISSVIIVMCAYFWNLFFRCSRSFSSWLGNCPQHSKEAGNLFTCQKRAQKRKLPPIQKRKLGLGGEWFFIKGAKGLEFSVHLLPAHVVTPDTSHWNHHSFWLDSCQYFTEYFIRTGLVVIYSCIQSVYICWVLTTYEILGSHTQDTEPTWRNLVIIALDTFKFLQWMKSYHIRFPLNFPTT